MWEGRVRDGNFASRQDRRVVVDRLDAGVLRHEYRHSESF